MSDFQADPNKSNSSSKSDGIGAVIFLIIFSLPFAGFGLLALVQGIRKTIAHDTTNGPMLCLFGLIFSLVGFGLIIGVIWGSKKVKQENALKARYADTPWMIRPDWAAGRVKASTLSQPTAYLIMGIAFSGMGGLATCFALPEVWRTHNYAAFLVLLFPIVGICFLGAFVAALRSVRRFGECFFEPAQIPIPIGGILDGVIQIGKPLQLEHELRLHFSCMRRIVTGSGKSRSVKEFPLWQTEKIYSEQAALLRPAPDQTGIPVHFRLPDDQPECYSRGDDSVFWRLEARSKMRGPDFRAVFDLPVFKVDGVAVADDEPDPTAALQAPIEEIRRDENSRIQVSDGPNGREFYFPPARNPGIAFMTTLGMLAFNGGAAAAYHFHAPIFFPIIFGLVGFLLIWGTISVWLKSTRVTIDRTNVRVISRWLFVSRTRQYSTGDVSRFEARTGMQSGSTIFQDIKLITRAGNDSFETRKARYQQTGEMPPIQFRSFDPSGITVAGSIASPLEAEWLVREMNQALGRSA